MAITPRTVFSEPINLLVFAFGILAVGGLVGVFVGADDAENTIHCQVQVQEPPDDSGRLDAGISAVDEGDSAGADDWAGQPVDLDSLDYTCRLEQPAPSWSEGQWLRHLGCMEARGESTEVMLAETTAAIDSVGLTPDLAVKKADYLKTVGSAEEHLQFLDRAVDRLGVVDGQLVHRLARALTWRGHSSDIERVRHLQLLSRMLMPESCEVLQTEIWSRHALAERMAEGDSTVARDGVQRAVSAYLERDCHERVHEGRWGVLAEIVGAGIAAEASNGHDGHSSLLRTVANSFDVRRLPTFCAEAVPEGTGLRSYCEKRMGDELFLSRR